MKQQYYLIKNTCFLVFCLIQAPHAVSNKILFAVVIDPDGVSFLALAEIPMITEQQSVEGIVVPMVTPLARLEILDVPALECLIEHLIGGGANGLFILGSCGEGPSLSYRLRRDLISRTCWQVANRIPVWVGVTDCSSSEADMVSQHAADAGASGVVLSPPFYYLVSRSELISFTRNRIKRSPLPTILYNSPELTQLNFDAECLYQLSDEEKLLGIKDNSGSLSNFQSLLEAARVRSDWRVLIGSEQLLMPALQLGGHGGISECSNIFPQLFVKIYKLSRSMRSPDFDKLLIQLNTLCAIYKIAGGGTAGAVKAIKTGLSVIGIGNGSMAEPLHKISKQSLESIRAIVQLLAKDLRVINQKL